MKASNFTKRVMGFFLGIGLLATGLFAEKQDRELQYRRAPDQSGLNQFEAPKTTDVKYEGLKVVVGGASALQFQAINQENTATADSNSFGELANNFNLPTANMDLDVQLLDGMRMHLRTYLSSQHHTEAWVKSGYIQIDQLDFITKGFLRPLMEMVTIKAGHMENNYGDAHFRRSDNGMTLHNPFVGNYIMDAFTTEVGTEIYVQKNGFLAMAGFTNGKLNQNVTDPGWTNYLSFIGKVGYDNTVAKDLRVRLTGSIYNNEKLNRVMLYSGDRAGVRYYSIGHPTRVAGFRTGRWNPGFSDKLRAIMINPFVKFMGFEAFGVIEFAEGGNGSADETKTAMQYAGDLAYRFGPSEKVYVALRYNQVDDEYRGDDVTIRRYAGAAGWFLTPNVLAKLEVVNQDYENFPNSDPYGGANFKGFIVESVISF